MRSEVSLLNVTTYEWSNEKLNYFFIASFYLYSNTENIYFKSNHCNILNLWKFTLERDVKVVSLQGCSMYNIWNLLDKNRSRPSSTLHEVNLDHTTDVLKPFTLRATLENIVCHSHTFENNYGMKPKFTEHLKRSSFLAFD